MKDKDRLHLPNDFDREKLFRICRANDVAMLGLFGSFARAEHTPSSDVDLLVEFSVPKSLLNLISLEQEISDELGRDVDLLTENALSPYLRDRVKEDLRVIYVSG
jgi:predicted nucleotidyltransferase